MQDLRKAEEAYQQVKQTYEMFYNWLLLRTPFFLDITTGFYRLGTNEAGSNELKKDISPTLEEINMQITAINQALPFLRKWIHGTTFRHDWYDYFLKARDALLNTIDQD